MKRYGFYIDGKWVSPKGRKTFPSLNPANKAALASFYEGSKADIDRAVKAAKKAYPKWSGYPAPRRGELLLKIARLLRRDKERLAQCIVKEMGKVIAEARGDVQEAIDLTEYMAGEGRRLLGYTTPSELRDKFACTVRRPVGVFALITPWNFPFAIPAWKIMPALICGNTVVWKPSSDIPLCAVELVKLLEEAGVPPGVVNLVTGSGEEVGTPLITHPDVRGVSFTGSREVGLEITKKAGLRKIGLELGGKNPIIVMDDADLDLAIDGVIFGAFGTTGQRCTAASRVIVHEKVRKAFEKKLVARAKRLKLGPGGKPSTDVGPLINQRAVDKVHKYTGIGRQEGAKLLCGGRPASLKGFYYLPTIFTGVKPGMRIAREEIFGPTVAILTVKSLEEAIKVASGVDYGLSSSIYTNNVRNAMKAAIEIEAGITYINSSTIGSEVHLPFGGVKDTGNGTREAGIEGIHEFSETKVIYIDYSGKLQKAQIDVVK